MNEFFSSLEAFLTAAESRAVDAVHQGTASLRKLADYLDAQAGGVKMSAPPADAGTVAALQARCEEVIDECSGADEACSTGKGKAKKGKAAAAAPVSAAGPGLLLLLQAILAILSHLKDQQAAE